MVKYMHWQIKEDKTWLTFSDISQCPRNATTTTKIACFPMLPSTCWELPQRSNRERHSVIRKISKHSCLNFSFERLITPEPNIRETPNLECTVRGIDTIDGGSHLLPISYIFNIIHGYWTLCQCNIRQIHCTPNPPMLNHLIVTSSTLWVHWYP